MPSNFKLYSRLSETKTKHNTNDCILISFKSRNVKNRNVVCLEHSTPTAAAATTTTATATTTNNDKKWLPNAKIQSMSSSDLYSF